jgi:hypothetical protein
MKLNEALSLQALLVALSQLDTALPSELQAEVQQVGDALARGRVAAVAAIDNIVNRHSLLHQLYQLAHLILEQRYQTWDQPRRPLPLEVAEEAIVLEQTAAQTLTAADPQAAAQAQLRQIQGASHHDTKVPPLLGLVYEVASEMQAKITAVLRAIERRPLTVENLCYALQLPVDQAKALVQYLWNAGYIATTGSVLPRLFSRLRRRGSSQYQSTPFSASVSSAQRSSQQLTVDFPAYFTLTAKGHFHLHPLVTAGRREGFV